MKNNIVIGGAKDTTKHFCGLISRLVKDAIDEGTFDKEQVDDMIFMALSRTLSSTIIRTVDNLSHLNHDDKVTELMSEPPIVALTSLIWDNINHED